MAILEFPSVETANEFGVLAVGGDLEVESLLLAYRSGIFPWPIPDEPEIVWFAPPKRAVLYLDAFRPSRRLERLYRNTSWDIRYDTAFEQVIHACAEVKNRGEGQGTWIRNDIIEAYIELHHAGYAHSVECFDGSKLIGGLYGVAIGGMFAGESMFYRVSNASKLCLYWTVEHLKERGARWLDCQQRTPLLARLGAKDLPRKRFMEELQIALNQEISLF